MNMLISLHNYVFVKIESSASWLLPSLARLIFAGTLFFYFWNSLQTKIGEGIFGFFSPTLGAYAQIFPRAMEAAGYDVSQMTAYHTLVVIAGTFAELILPILLIVGLFTRLAAIGMIGFIVVQSMTDIIGHAADAETIGTWFDRFPDALIVDQRSFWVFVLLVLVVKGAGPLSLDRMLRSQVASG